MATTTLTPTLAAAVAEPKRPTTPAQTTFGCAHIKALLAAVRPLAVDHYTKIISSIHSDNGFTTRFPKTAASGAPPANTAKVTYLCLQCPDVSAVRERHRKDHPFSVESRAGFVYCHDCRDFVYDPTFEAIRSAPTSRKRKITPLPVEDRRLITSNAAPTSCAATGLRGLYNMGQTCFMSVVLQSLVHNPFIRSYYLTEGHRSQREGGTCAREACVSCAVDDLFTDFWGADKHEGFGAVHMLQGCWKEQEGAGAGLMRGYGQQDAHEFMGFFLEALHTANLEAEDAKADEGVDDAPGDEDDKPANDTAAEAVTASEESPTKKAKKRDKHDPSCPCIVHTTFSGTLKSTVTCTTCRTTTSTLDPFLDLSLDIRSGATTVIKKQKLALINGTKTIKEVLPMTLTECLDRFTQPEILPVDGAGFWCKKCGTQREARKRLRIARAPLVLPVHLKRFEHRRANEKGKGGGSSKVETRVRMPLELDLAPYLVPVTSAAAAAAAVVVDGATPARKEAVTEEGERPQRPLYELSSVIVHKGTLDNGHYISYARQRGEWFRFDDSMVVRVGEGEVLGGETEVYLGVYALKGV